MLERASSVEHIDSLLNPRNVVLLGARETSGSWADSVHANLERYGYAGSTYSVNPRHSRLWGEPCYPSLDDLPEAPDHVVVLLPAQATVDALRAAKTLGRSATVYASFPDTDLLSELADIADSRGLALSGPNCLGNVSVPVSLVTTVDPRLHEIKNGPVAVVGQSGGVVTALHRSLVSRGIGSKYVVSSGNETCLTTADYLRFFAADDEIKVVLAFVESVRDWPSFQAACLELSARGKHLVALKVGHSPDSRQAAASHTGALAGSYAAFEAATGPLGVITASSLDIAVEISEYLARVKPPAAGRLGAVTISGGVRELLIDSASRQDISFPALTESTQAELAELLGDIDISNPLDSNYPGLSDTKTLVRCVEIVAADPGVDVILLQEELVDTEQPAKEAALAILNEAFSEGTVQGSGKPVALMSMRSLGLTPYGRQLRDSLPSLAFLQSTDKAVAAVAAIARTQTWTAASRIVVDPTASPRRASALETFGPSADSIDEVRAKAIFAQYGFATPEERFVSSPEEARAAAASLRAPFVVKLVSEQISHKTEVGGVILNLASADEVMTACKGLLARNQGITGFLIAEQVTTARVELVLGFVRDPEVGPIVMIGTGGLGVELFDDVAFAPVPCSREDAELALRRTKASKLLGPWRGRPECDFAAVVEAIYQMSRFAAELGDEISSAEINPLAAVPGEAGVLMLDALVIPNQMEQSAHRSLFHE